MTTSEKVSDLVRFEIVRPRPGHHSYLLAADSGSL
ncbi:hypothetical protein ABIA39_004778 [Nocardia sp. GAS34]